MKKTVQNKNKLLQQLKRYLHPKATHLQAGATAENLARQFLQQRGLKLIQTNYRSRFGEIDLIMQQKTKQINCLVFIEVRYRQRNQQQAMDSIDFHKQQRLKKTAQFYLQQHPLALGQNARFDVVVLSGELKQSDNTAIHWIVHAFE